MLLEAIVARPELEKCLGQETKAWLLTTLIRHMAKHWTPWTGRFSPSEIERLKRFDVTYGEEVRKDSQDHKVCH
jgi:hypothetical protein